MITAKFFGAVFLVTGGYLGGRACRAEYRTRLKTIRTLITSLARIRAEITLRLTPLPELITSECAFTDGRVQAFYREVSRLYDEDGSFQASWDDAIDRLRTSAEERGILSSLGTVLGRYDAHAQEEALRYAEDSLARCAEAAENDLKLRGMLMSRLLPGIALAAAILLW
ncbi:MAG: stage III sporulation protein AB [Clostridiaceae bacterium]|nr:stage III sporulation protein AB [Clostridiaceae bacterium]